MDMLCFGVPFMVHYIKVYGHNLLVCKFRITIVAKSFTIKFKFFKLITDIKVNSLLTCRLYPLEIISNCQFVTDSKILIFRDLNKYNPLVFNYLMYFFLTYFQLLIRIIL